MHRLLNSPGTPSPPQPPYVITWTVKIRPFPCPTQNCDLHRTGYIVGSPGEWVLVSHLLANLLNMQQRSQTIRHRQPSCSLRAWAKTSHLLVTKNARTCGQQNSTPMCNEMQVASIDWMLWNNQLLVGQILLYAICSLQADSENRVCRFAKVVCCDLHQNSGQIFHWISVTNAGLMGGLPICSLENIFFSWGREECLWNTMCNKE